MQREPRSACEEQRIAGRGSREVTSVRVTWRTHAVAGPARTHGRAHMWSRQSSTYRGPKLLELGHHLLGKKLDTLQYLFVGKRGVGTPN